MLKHLQNLEIAALEAKDNCGLGDRSDYIGASDIGGCLRASFLNKTQKVSHTAEQNRIFKRGHIAETFIRDALASDGTTFAEQVEVSNASNTLRAHIDFCVEIDGKTAIIEVKSVGIMPQEPYEAWKLQVSMQRKLLADTKNVAPQEIAACIYAINLNEGKVSWFPIDYDEELTQRAFERAEALEAALLNDSEPAAERQFYCNKCAHRDTCSLLKIGSASDSTADLAEEVAREHYRIKDLEADLKLKKERLKAQLEADGVSRLSCESGLVTLTSASTRKSLDSTRLKKEQPELYEAYLKESAVAPTLKIG